MCNGILFSHKKNEVLLHAATWMKHDNIMLNEISQTLKDKYVWFYLYEISRIGKFTETESRLEVTRDWGEGRMGSYCLMFTEFLFGGNEKVLETGNGNI